MVEKLKGYYHRVIKWARTERALSIISFAESSFFPIPPDPILINMTLENPKKWIRFAAITTGASVIGGVFGYLIGFALFESFGEWIISTYHLEEKYQTLGDAFSENSLLTIFAAALTPIPYKIFTITAGAFKINWLLFVIASIFGRGLRFTAVAWATNLLGKKYQHQISQYIDRISLAILGFVILVAIVYSQI